MKILDGKGAVLGRLASFAAKQALKGEDIIVVNCKEIIITGRRKFTEENFRRKRGRVGTAQKGPKVSRLSHIIVKRAIRGMLPEHRWGRGREAFKRIKCYPDVPKEFESQEKITFNDNKTNFIKIRDISK
ncbi:MAG: 50S ribosomal protein L13 [Nanoarchaeota archaeon]